MSGRVHIIGAGMAGLACAVELVQAGRAVTLHEAAARAGGRCRSYHDELLGRLIDNGNHLILGANPSLFRYLDTVGARSRLICPETAFFPFVDLATGERWTVRPNRGRLPWWIFSARRRIPGTSWRDYLAALKLARAKPGDTVAEAMGTTTGAIVSRLLEPLTVAVLNASYHEGAARLLWPVMRLTFGAGEAACRPYFPREGLGPDVVEPGVAFVAGRGGEIRFNERVRALELARDRVVALDFGSSPVPLGVDDAVVLAVPPSVAIDLLPGLAAPLESRAIVNLHFKLARPVTLPEGSLILGLVNSTAQWIFAKGEVASVTVSAADALAERPAEEIAALIWSEVSEALDLRNQPLPPYRVVKEKRATFAQVPSALAQRPSTTTKFKNLWLAGDWTDTGLPATIEGAVRSGQMAARHLIMRAH
ncbi:MAG: amine oxidase [Alphaproteobacteria bacterium]|nr:amine oxidase [Alphaproteobacteria bacterium]